jgi:hypothetical protein
VGSGQWAVVGRELARLETSFSSPNKDDAEDQQFTDSSLN